MDSVSNATTSHSSFSSPVEGSKTDTFGHQYIRFLGFEYNALVRSNRLGKATVQQVLDFQDRLNASPLNIKSSDALKTMEQGSGVLLSYLLANPTPKAQPKTPSRPYRPAIRPSFVHNGQGFSIRTTRGDGACALHSLLGEERNGTYVARNPRKGYAQGLVSALNQKNRAVEDRFVNAMTSALNATSDRHSLALFKDTTFKALWNDFKRNEKKAIDQIKSRENAFWMEKLGVPRDQVMENPKHYSSLLSPDDQVTARNFTSTRQAFLNDYDGKKRAFILSKPFVNHYCKKVQNSSFYFDTQEIGIAAHLFNKKVEMFNPHGKGETINPNASGETVHIFHRGAHFSRCTPVLTFSTTPPQPRQRPIPMTPASRPPLGRIEKSKRSIFRRMFARIAALFSRLY